MLRTLTLLALTLCPSLALAHADTLTTYTLSGSLGTGAAAGALSGTVVLDTTTGLFNDPDFTIRYTGITYLFDTTVSTFPVPKSAPAVTLGVFDDTSGGIFQLALPETSLVGFTGSRLCTAVAPCAIPGGSIAGGFLPVVPGDDFTELQSGTLIPRSLATPELSPIALCLSGLLSGAGLLLRPRRLNLS